MKEEPTFIIKECARCKHWSNTLSSCVRDDSILKCVPFKEHIEKIKEILNNKNWRRIILCALQEKQEDITHL